jgi:hypothetical protein
MRKWSGLLCAHPLVHNLGCCTSRLAPPARDRLPSPPASAVANSQYGSKMYVWDWQQRTIKQTIDLGPEGEQHEAALRMSWMGGARYQPHPRLCQPRALAAGMIPLETRFMHDPDSCHAFVGAALSSNVIACTVDKGSGTVSGGPIQEGRACPRPEPQATLTAACACRSPPMSPTSSPGCPSRVGRCLSCHH